MIFKMRYTGSLWMRSAGTMSFASLTDVVAAAMEQWITQNRVCIVEGRFKNGDSVFKTQ
jgi:hypothetical protein